MTTTRCLFCDEPATRYCDEALAMVCGDISVDKQKRERRLTTMAAMLSASYTCDAPCCPAHASLFGHYCAGEDSDTFDRCAGCQSDPVKLDGTGTREVMFPSEIEAMRNDRHARWRRRRMVAVSTGVPA